MSRGLGWWGGGGGSEKAQSLSLVVRLGDLCRTVGCVRVKLQLWLGVAKVVWAEFCYCWQNVVQYYLLICLHRACPF